MALARNAAAERARAFGLGQREVDDLKTAVSEACSDVVLHAYPDDVEERPLEVEVHRRDGAVRVVGEIASRIELRSERARGTEIAFELPLCEQP